MGRLKPPAPPAILCEWSENGEWLDEAHSACFSTLFAVDVAAASSRPESSATESAHNATLKKTMATDAADAVKELVAVLREFDQFRATFTQLTQDAEGTVLQEMRGTVQLRRPRQFYWRVTEPYQQTIVVLDSTLWIVDDDLEQVTVQSLSEQMGPSPAVLLSSDPSEIDQRYQVSRESLPGGAIRFSLTPRSEEALFDRLRVVFQDGLLQEMDFRDSLGQSTAIDFANGLRHAELDKSLFQVSIPDGYDVIDDRK
ncbi:MAG: outer membrane lipoprotein chaperone LolA [Gammaproteobacteria bacterium]